MSPRARTYDESDVRIRPNRRGSRPRTKDRPAHEDAIPGFVTGVDRGRYTLIVHGGGDHVVVAMKARELGRKSVVIGDEVALVGDTSGGSDSLARIVRVEPRRTVLRRTADDTDPVERIIVANAEQLVIVTALADPEPRPRMIDRCLVAAYDAGMEPLLVLTKADLVDPAPFLAHYAMLSVRHLVTSRDPESHAWIGLEPLLDLLVGRISVFIGHSGVGKSTLVNELLGEDRQKTAEVRGSDSRGRHTTTHRELFELPGGALLVDTPGIRALEVLGVDEGLESAFGDIVSLATDCRFRNCAHDREPGCAVRAALADGRLSQDRLASHRKLEREMARAARQEDPRARAEHRRTWRIIQKSVGEHMTRKYGAER